MSIALIAYKCVSSINSSTDRIIEVINTERLEYPEILNNDWLKKQSKRIGDAINENYANPEFKKFNVTNATFKCELVTILSVTKIEET